MTSRLGLLLFKVELRWHFETYFVVSSEQIFERQDAGSEKHQGSCATRWLLCNLKLHRLGACGQLRAHDVELKAPILALICRI